MTKTTEELRVLAADLCGKLVIASYKTDANVSRIKVINDMKQTIASEDFCAVSRVLIDAIKQEGPEGQNDLLAAYNCRAIKPEFIESILASLSEAELTPVGSPSPIPSQITWSDKGTIELIRF